MDSMYLMQLFRLLIYWGYTEKGWGKCRKTKKVPIESALFDIKIAKGCIRPSRPHALLSGRSFYKQLCESG